MIEEKYVFSDHSFPYLGNFIQSFGISDPILPSKWIEENFILSNAYAAPGPLKLFPWQIQPVNAIIDFDVLLFIAAVQTGKSMLVEAITAYLIATTIHNMLFIYAKRDTVEEVFDERLKPMIQEVPEIRKYWSGDERDLTKKRLKLMHLIIRIASAGLKTDIATHNAGVILGDELAKWPTKDFSQIKAIEGRKQASRMMGRRTKSILCTSPDNDQDPSYIECHKPGTVWFRPHYECPHCHTFQYFIDSQVKERPNRAGKRDHNTERIRKDGAAYYECENCKNEITEKERLEASFNMKWLTKEGKISYDDIVNDHNHPRRAVFQWPRFVDTTWTFSDCLCSYFNAYNSLGSLELKTYRNEDMADWVKLFSKKFDNDILNSKKQKYLMYGENACVPDGVSFLMIGMDTQDNGFYYVVRGYGKNFESWLVRCDFIECDMNDKKFSNSITVYEYVYHEIMRHRYIKRNGKKVSIFAGIIDEGGHRKSDVDSITNHWHVMISYKGSSYKTIQIAEQKKSGIIQGNTENLSRIVAKQMESNIWHLPRDVPETYITQVLNEYDETYVDARGNDRTRWIQKENNHYRSCENYLIALGNVLELPEILHDDAELENVEHALVKRDTEEKKDTEKGSDYDNFLQDFDHQLKEWGW